MGEWTRVQVADLGGIVTGRTPPGNDPAYYDGDVPFLTPSDMVGHRQVEHTARSLSQYGAKYLARCLIPHGVGVSCIGWQMGKAVLIDRPTVTNQQINSVVVNESIADSSFVYYSLVARRREIFNLGAGGSRTPILNKGDFGRLPFMLPPLPEQRAIAHILGTLDDKIELNRRMNESLEAMARALFKSWFVDFEPVRAKVEGRETGLPKAVADLFPDRLVDSEMGGIPEGWRAVQLPDVFDVNPTRALPRGVEAPYLDMANMPTQGHSPDNVVDRAFGSGMRFMNGDTLVARITPCLENGKTAFVDFLEAGQVGWGSTEYIVLRLKPPLPEEFAYCLARATEFRDFAIQSMTGSSGRQRVPAESLSHFRVIAAPKPIAEMFGRFNKPLFARARAATKESRTLAALRDILLPSLIAGKLRIEAAEHFIKESSL